MKALIRALLIATILAAPVLVKVTRDPVVPHPLMPYEIPVNGQPWISPCGNNTPDFTMTCR